MGHFLHFGAGPNQLPEPWQNLDPSHDIRKPLRFQTDSVSAIAAEHVIEHVPFLQGFGFMHEALRVLEPGGWLRLAFPDVSKFVREEWEEGAEPRAVNGQKLLTGWSSKTFTLAPNAAVYAEGLSKRPAAMGWFGNHPPTGSELERKGLSMLLRGWGHAACWTLSSAAGCLLVAGFSKVYARGYGWGELAGIDGHHHDVGEDLAKLETTILEAQK